MTTILACADYLMSLMNLCMLYRRFLNKKS